MRKIAVLTSGGDAPGMNAAIRGVVRCASSRGMEVYGIERGYDGLIKGNIFRMDSRSVSDTIQKGGTILKTARCPEFETEEGIKKGGDVLKAYGIEGLVVIGGDGSFRGMKDLSQLCGIVCMGIPGTIDNDLGYTDFTLGFDTAVNTVLDALNKIRDTMTSHDRACIIEVMGRHCGDIALYSGMAGGAESIIVPELPFNIDEICAKMRRNVIKGKVSDIIVLAEGVCSAEQLKAEIHDRTGVTIRTVKLGYIQRGGTPSMADRVLAARCADRAVELLYEDSATSRVIGIKNNVIVDVEIEEALSIKKQFNEKMMEIANRLSF
ncbi:MAG TPA: 6-phosphofructokinase [Candidatus Stercoripulliclostridium merdigallinarum]|uniref:ATP-dependent 6-phosphofructokinase n=1 Tax=Candidatus Stercoripulliclostridium merdigallinarum TaxID=2840951 RepID=A0A9D1SHX1_9FIRM|nr:6-phosphofructokinase [Candidatus Stercoripulliclostridium merdigallinarum]